MIMKRERDESSDDLGNSCSGGLMACCRSKVARCVQQTMDVNQGTSTTSDYLSQLPEDLLLSIFSYLPLRNIVQTSVLSKYLNNAAASISRLNFNSRNMFLIERNFDPPTGEEPEDCCGEHKQRFVDGVNQFLKFHQGRNILAVTLSFCLELDDKEQIDRWIRIAIKKDVTELELAFSCNECITVRAKNLDKYVLSPELFEGGPSTKLSKLRLCCCELSPKFSVVFLGLTSLILEVVRLNKHDLQSMFLCLPKLKTLHLFRCHLPAKLSFGSLPLLSELSVKFCSGLSAVEFWNTGLSSIHFLVMQKISCSISGAPNLNTLGHSTGKDGLRYIFTSLATKFPSLENLYVYTSIDWAKYIPNSIRTFNNLKFLKLSFRMRVNFDILRVISILRAVPVLEHLELLTNCLQDIKRGKVELGEHVHPCLIRVVIGALFCTPHQLKLISYLLEYAAALKSLTIYKMVMCEFYMPFPAPWQNGERENVCQLLRESFGCEYKSDSGGFTRGNTEINVYPNPNDELGYSNKLWADRRLNYLKSK